MFSLRRNTICFAAIVFLSSKVVLADVPKVVADILPVHSLVSQVMEGVGSPELILDAGADPHSNAMRPSQAAVLNAADVVFQIGPALTPWLERPIETLAGQADIVTLLDIEGATLLSYRDAGGDDHVGDIDPHAWLDVGNARLWLAAIAETLAKHDPEHKDAYLQNAAAAQDSLSNLQDGLAADLQSIGPYGVHHDAFQYFETSFGLRPNFVIKEDDSHQPGPSRIAKLRTQIREKEVACVFVEPLVNRGLVETVLSDSSAIILELDPIGASIDPGPGLFPQVLRNMAQTMGLCR